jgi:hypothetical protein
LLDIRIRPGMGLPMKLNNSHSTGRRIIDDSPGIPCPPRRATAQTEPQDSPRPTRVKKEEPKWKNMTLDELKSWLADAKRRAEDLRGEAAEPAV